MTFTWLGKIIGAYCGFLIAGPFGALFGFFIGNLFDRGLLKQGIGSRGQAQQAFFTATFLIMGYIAKANGRVSENEIQMARYTMRRLGLNSEQQKLAIHLFNQGKQPDFDLDAALQAFRKTCPFHPGLMRLFLDIQIQAAYADGYASGPVKHILQYTAKYLGLGFIDFTYFDAIRGQYTRWQQNNTHQKQQYTYQNPQKSLLDEAYELLCTTKQTSDSDLKKAYRRMMNQHHPDKLISKGLPEEMIKLATEKTQKIQAAYHQICQTRGLR